MPRRSKSGYTTRRGAAGAVVCYRGGEIGRVTLDALTGAFTASYGVVTHLGLSADRDKAFRAAIAWIKREHQKVIKNM
jgi:hypothetical protein